MKKIKIVIGSLFSLLALFVFSTKASAAWTYYPYTINYTVVASAPTPITVSLSASPTSMTLPTNQTTLTWSTTGSPDSCTASNAWSGSKSASGGSELISGLSAGNYVFDITCVKSGVSNAFASVLVVVTSPSTPSGTLIASGCSISAGASSCGSGSVSWTTANLTGGATEITRNVGTPASFTPSPLSSGSQSVTISYGQTDFYLYHNISGTPTLLAQASATASCTSGTSWNGSTCQNNPNPPTASLSANPSSITAGGSSTLTWSSTNATSCSGSGFNTGGLTAGNTSVSPASTTTYTVVCTGAGGTDQASATVTVGGAPKPQCSDGIDNDSDGLIDYPNDPGCASDSDTTELKRLPIWKEF